MLSINSIASSFFTLYYFSKNSRSASNSKDSINYIEPIFKVNIPYFLGSHYVKLQKVESTAMFLRVKGIVDHEVGSN